MCQAWARIVALVPWNCRVILSNLPVGHIGRSHLEASVCSHIGRSRRQVTLAGRICQLVVGALTETTHQVLQHFGFLERPG